MREMSKWCRLSAVIAVLGIAAPVMQASEQGTNGDCVNDGAGNFNNAHGAFNVSGGQISGAGATLFVDFFRAPASTNDFVDVDNDGIQGFSPMFPFVDQLGSPFVPGLTLNTYWNFQYRSVGSVNGFNEFVQNQICGDIPTSVPGEAGVFNGFEYATGGLTNWGGPFANASGTPFEPCEIEFSFLDVPSVWAVQVPADQNNPPRWNANPLSAGYGINPIPSSTGYTSGLQPLTRACSPGACSVTVAQSCSFDLDCPSGETCVGASGFASLNQNFGSPDADTIYDFVGAWVPIVYISNRGTGLRDVRMSEMQHLFVSGRMPNGENLVAATRSVGSGTRNGHMNSSGIDTSWGRGDNLGPENPVTGNFNVGPSTQPTNAQGSSQIEQAVLTHRLAVGYTGLAGPSRAAQDAQNGLYEVLNICKDVDGDGNPLCDCTPQACASRMGCSDTGVSCVNAGTCNPGASCIPNADADRANNGYVRPAISTVLDNCDACCGYQIGGNGSFVTRGNPDSNRDPLDPEFNAIDPQLDNQQVANYIINIEDSVRAFEGNVNSKVCSNDLLVACTTSTQCLLCSDGSTPCTPAGSACGVGGTCNQGSCVDQLNMPGQFLATTFFLPPGLDCQQALDDGMDFSTVTSPLNQALQTFIRNNNGLGIGGDTPAFGAANQAGRIPTRNTIAGYQYSDGRSGGAYVYWNGAAFVTTAGNNLAQRNRIAGDFDEDVDRDINDFDEMVTAYYTPRTYQQSPVGIGGGNPGNMATDNAIPEILGDFNADGSFTKEDLRYAMDGLALSGGVLDRKAGAVAVDTQILALAQPFPWADTRRDLVIPPAVGSNPTFMAAKNVNAVGDEFNATAVAYKPGDFRCDVAGGDVSASMPAGHEQQCINSRCELDGNSCTPTLCSDLTTACPNGDIDCPAGFRCRYGAPECLLTAPAPGADPRGWDGRCDDEDIDYVLRNQGSWTDLDEAVFIDASADMNGDLTAAARVDYDDVDEILVAILGTVRGDLNLDGVLNSADTDTFFGTLATDPTGCNAAETCGWAEGDCTGDGIVDAADVAVCFPTLFPDGVPGPATAPSPHDRRKNRYISFTPNNQGAPVAFRVTKTSNPTGSCFVQAPILASNAVPAQNAQYTATCDATPHFSTWKVCQNAPTACDMSADCGANGPCIPIPFVHVGDCEIIPVANYEVASTLDGVVFSAALPTPTILVPNINSKLWGDLVGTNNGVEWTPPNQITNVSDILAIQAVILSSLIRPPFSAANLQAISSSDSCLNPFINTSDILISVRSIAGDAYGPPSTGKIVDPALCAPCP